jgi:hypothetical protein
LAASEQYPQAPTPAMTYGSGGRDYGAGSALGAGIAGYTERSDTRSELPSPPLGSPDPLLGGMGGRAPDRLAPPPGGPISWGSQEPHSNPSVSDYSDYGGNPHGAAAGAAGGLGVAAAAGATALAHHQQGDHAAHELPESEHDNGYGGARTLSNGSQSHHNPAQHQRTFSGSSHQYAGAVSPQTVHSRTMSDSSTHAQNYHMSMGSDNPYAAELHGSAPSSNQGAELEANLQQRMDYERKPFRPGHSLTKNKGDIDPSRNF